MTKPELIEQLKRLAMGRLDACEPIADLLMPDGATFNVTLAEMEADLEQSRQYVETLPVFAKKKAK